jgi:putative endonuclease
MAFRRSPVRSRSGPPTFAHACHGSVSYGWQATRRVSTIAARRRLQPRRWTNKPQRHLPPDSWRRFCAFSVAPEGSAYPLKRQKQNPRQSVRNQTCSHARRMWVPRCCVYVLRSCPDPDRYYTGVTSDWRARLEAHNAGRCPHTANGRPWQIDVVVEFADERRAVAFERYLKSGSGCAFAKSALAASSCGIRPDSTAWTR